MNAQEIRTKVEGVKALLDTVLAQTGLGEALKAPTKIVEHDEDDVIIEVAGALEVGLAFEGGKPEGRMVGYSLHGIVYDGGGRFDPPSSDVVEITECQTESDIVQATIRELVMGRVGDCLQAIGEEQMARELAQEAALAEAYWAEQGK